MFDETGDEELAQGWTPLVLDTNGNGRREAWVEPDQPVDPTKDKRIASGFYAISPAPDGSVWGSTLGYPGAVLRLVPGPNPSESALAGSFDRSKCRGPLNGPTAAGQHSPGGLDVPHRASPAHARRDGPGESRRRATTPGWTSSACWGSARTCRSTPATSPRRLLALPNGAWVVLRVPYPLGFYTKWLDGRVDDPDGGWKGRGLWATVSTRAPFHMEGGKGRTS